MNDFLKADEATKMTSVQVILSLFQLPQTVTKSNEIVRVDHRMSIRMIAEIVNADKETVTNSLQDELNMKKIYVKLVPKNFTTD